MMTSFSWNDLLNCDTDLLDWVKLLDHLISSNSSFKPEWMHQDVVSAKTNMCSGYFVPFSTKFSRSHLECTAG